MESGNKKQRCYFNRGQTAVNAESILDIEKNKKANEIITFNILQGGVKKEVNLKLENKLNRSFTISRKENLTDLQRRILESWLTKN